MMRPIRLILLLAVILAFPAGASQDPVTLDWDALLPEGEIDLLNKLYEEQNQPLSFGHRAEPMLEESVPQVGTFNTVAALDGKKVRLPGFIVPIDYTDSGTLKTFLLVPYQGACIHLPPPPPNQIVYVETEQTIELEASWMPVWLTGTLRTKSNMNNLGNAAYSMTLSAWKPYEE